MNPHRDIESLLRSLQPGELPADLKARLRSEPPRHQGPRHRKIVPFAAAAGMSAAACLALWFRPAESVTRPAPPVTVHHRDSELIASRTLGYVEKDGRIYQIEERLWRDAESALCSTTPVRVSLAADRREVVYEPVSFD